MTTIWHNPRCSKSRQTLKLLEEQGEKITIRTYLHDAPSADELQAALAQLGLRAIDITRTGEKLFRELGLGKSDDDKTLIAALAANPALIERPIVFKEGRAAIGRPPENVLDIL